MLLDSKPLLTDRLKELSDASGVHVASLAEVITEKAADQHSNTLSTEDDRVDQPVL